MDMFALLQFGLLIKLFFLVLCFFYFVFAVVVYRQVSLMTQTLDSQISPLIKLVAVGQIAGTAMLFFLAVILA
jgi:hypothetical protein